MNREEELLREACAQLAREETDQLERSLTDEEKNEAEALFRRHRRRAFRIIARSASSSSDGRRTMWLRIAACLILAVGGLFLALRPSILPPDQTPLSGVPSPSVAPYYTASPTAAALTPAPAETPAPTDTPAPVPTESPTDVPVLDALSTPIPTETPIIEESATETPTESPRSYTAPEQWTGAHFPQQLPEGYVLALVSKEEGAVTAAYGREGHELFFKEYDTALSVAVPRQGERSYVQLENGVVALRIEEDEGVTLAWDQDGRTLKLYGEEADVLAVANSVVLLP